jgi:hypothetical protein
MRAYFRLLQGLVLLRLSRVCLACPKIIVSVVTENIVMLDIRHVW